MATLPTPPQDSDPTLARWLYLLWKRVNPTALTNEANTFTALQTTAASAITGAGLNIPHGTAPSAPQNGDIWTTAAGIYVRINGATVGPLS